MSEQNWQGPTETEPQTEVEPGTASKDTADQESADDAGTIDGE